jgi:hypothetical protein
MTAAIVGMFVFVMINSFVCMDDLKADIDDINNDGAATNFGKKFKTAPLRLFKVVITLIFGAIAITQLLEIW